MALDKNITEEIKSLCDSLCEDQLDDEKVKRLEEIVLNNPEACSFYVRYMSIQGNFERYEMDFDSSIPFETQIRSHENSELGAESNHDLEKDREMNVSQISAKPNRWLGSFNDLERTDRHNIMLFVTVCALVFVFGFLAYFFQQDNLKPGISDTADKFEKQDESDTVPENQIRATQLTNLDQGIWVTVRENAQTFKLEDGTTLIGHRGAKFITRKKREVTLEKGDIYLIVAKSKTPFFVNTDDGEIKATGTRFAVSAGRNTVTSVAQGKVTLTSESGSSKLGAGDQGTLSKGTKPTRSPAPRISHLVSWAKDALKQTDLLVKKTDKENGLVAVDPWGQESRLGLRRYDVDVYIEDGIARTTIDQTFFNHNPWNTEGTFYFPLPPDASVSRLAMYVAGKLNEGGMVSRERGQQIYTQILHQRRDPALLEMMEGNMFKMRIFPLEGRQEKRIFLSYTQTLTELYGNQKYWFPMDHVNSVAKKLSLRIHIKNGAKNFVPTSSTHDLRKKVQGDDLILEYSKADVKPDQDLLLSLIPTENKNEEPGSSEIGTFSDGDKNYIYANLKPQLKGNVTSKPRQWIVLNDQSASRSKLNGETQRYVLSRLIEEADDDDSLFLVDVGIQPKRISKQFHKIRSDQSKSLLDREVKINFGGTNLKLAFEEVKKLISEFKLENPHVLYLGDGVATDGEKKVSRLPDFMPNEATFVGIGIGKGVDGLLLQSVADKTNGLFTTINPDEDINWRIFDLIASINTPRLTEIEIILQDKAGKQIKAQSYTSSKGMTAGESINVVARCDSELPSRILFRAKQGKKTISKGYSLKNATLNSAYIPRLWAKRHIDEMLKSDQNQKDEIVELSKKYYVVTPYTSLIVLESDAMYEEFKVERGRDDHWALYGAPKEIDVVHEPLDYSTSRWGWGWNRYQGKDAKIDAKLEPKTVQEIVDSVQVRINAPFYYSQPTQAFNSRTDLYALVDEQLAKDRSDPSKLLTLLYLYAAKHSESVKDFIEANKAEGASSSNDSDRGKVGSLAKRKPRFQEKHYRYRQFMMPELFEGWEARDGSFLPRTSSLTTAQTATMSRFSIIDRLERFEGLVQGLDNSRGFGRGGRGFGGGGFGGGRGFISNFASGPGLPSIVASRKKSRRLMQLARQNAFLNNQLGPAQQLPQTSSFGDSRLKQSFQSALRIREARISADVEKFNRNHWGWQNRWNEWNDGSEVDFDMSGETDLFFEEMIDELMIVNESKLALYQQPQMGLRGGLARDSQLSSLYQSLDSGILPPIDFAEFELPQSREMPRGSTRRILPRSALAGVLRNSVRNQPGSTSVLAADYLLQRKSELEKGKMDDTEKRELRSIQVALENIEVAAAKLENSGRFWSYGWSYRPSRNAYQAPIVQVFRGYNWSFDLTQYASGLYSSAGDMEDAVARQFAHQKPIGSITEEATKLIQDSLNQLKPTSVIVSQGGSKLHVGPNGKFAWTTQSPMSLESRTVCDGKDFHQFYDELGLAAKRRASEARLGRMYQILPHLIRSPESMSQLFDVELVSKDAESFVLKMTPATPPEPKTEDANDKDSEPTSKPKFHFLVKCDHQGRVLSKTLYGDGKVVLRSKMDYSTENKIKSTWFVFDDQEKKEVEIAKSEISTEPFSPTKETFQTDRADFVAIEMPLRKPSYYQKKMADSKVLATKSVKEFAIESKEEAEKVADILRSYALACIQEYEWRRWGGQNQNARTAIDKLAQIANEWKIEMKVGDLALYGSAGIYFNSHPFQPNGPMADLLEKHKDQPISKFFVARTKGWRTFAKADSSEQQNLTTHLASYQHATERTPDAIKYFNKMFPNSPLGLALVQNTWNNSASSVPRWFELHQSQTFRDLALEVGAQFCNVRNSKKDEPYKAIREEFARQYWKLFDSAKTDQERLSLPLNSSIAMLLRENDAPKLSKFIDQLIEEVKKTDSITAYLVAAEELSGLQEPEKATKLIEFAKEEIAKKQEEQGLNISMTAQLALVQTWWTCGQTKRAHQELVALMDQLNTDKIAPTATLLAMRARLEQQVGHAQEAVKYEELSLAIEQKYLPSKINLQAFRQRYNWLWGQYVAAIQAARSNNQSKVVDDLIARAKLTLERWFEIDRDNAGVITGMASLLNSAGKSDAEIWQYLSTLIDLKPRDAQTFVTVGNWYQQNKALEEGEKWIAQAYQWDTANPRWLWEHGLILKRMGKKELAAEKFQQIVNGKWAPGLQGYIKSAQKELN